MQKKFEVKTKSIYTAPIKILESYIFLEFECNYGMRVQTTGYKFVCGATSDGSSEAVLSSVDFFITDADGGTVGYTLYVARSIFANPTTESEKIATVKSLSLKAINKYRLVLSLLYSDDNTITINAQDFVTYVIRKFYSERG